MLNWAKSRLKKVLGIEFSRLESSVIEVGDIRELRKLFGWDREAVLDDPRLHDFDYPEDLNMRRPHDAEVIGTVMANARPDRAREIGISEGRTTALMAANAPETEIRTVNIPPEELARGEGGKLTTGALDVDQIGAYYRERGCQNVHQILAKTYHWIYAVCIGIEELYRAQKLSGRIYHLRDSWVGLYRVPN